MNFKATHGTFPSVHNCVTVYSLFNDKCSNNEITFRDLSALVSRFLRLAFFSILMTALESGFSFCPSSDWMWPFAAAVLLSSCIFPFVSVASCGISRERNNEWTIQYRSTSQMNELISNVIFRVFFAGNNRFEKLFYWAIVCSWLTLLKSIEFSRLFNCSSAASIKPCMAVTTISIISDSFARAQIWKINRIKNFVRLHRHKKSSQRKNYQTEVINRNDKFNSKGVRKLNRK